MLSSAGVSMEDSVALIVGGNESVQNAEKVGTALKTIGINMSGIKASADSGKISLNKTAKTLQETAKINVLDKQTGQVRDMMSILDELAEKWHSVGEDALTKNQKSGIAEAINFSRLI